ncbi:MAG TPA: hypothetical protein VG077_09510, partial [Verrucomicrobiae bacterium]|nr:hypothetical protein [Verrucomicrobiae bacterium]
MKRLTVFAVLFAALSLSPMARAQENPDDQYLIIYALIQQADAFDSSGQPRRALDDYAEAQDDLQKFQKVFPDWNPRIVNFRLKYLAEKIAGVTASLPSTNAPPPTAAVPAAPGTPPGSTNTAAAIAAATAQLQSQLSALQEQVRRLQGNNETLQSKLKEALAAQPATVSPAQLAQVQQQLRALMKENDLLKVSQAQGNGGAAAGVDAKDLELLKQALAEANRKLAAQTERAGKLSQENQTLQTRLQSLLASADAAEALRQENELLKKQVASLQSAPAPVVGTGNAAAELAGARTQIATLQSAAEVNLLEKIALENRLKQLQSMAPKPPPAVAGPSQAENEARIRELQQERDDL